MIVCGHSLGAWRRPGPAHGGSNMDALALLAPGHFPERLAAQGLTNRCPSRAVDRHSRPVKRRLALTDCNQGIVRRLRVRPQAISATSSQQGPAQWPANARAIAPATDPRRWSAAGIPLLAGIDYAFAHTPHHPRSEYIEIDADHADTPATLGRHRAAWIASSNRIQDHDRPSPCLPPDTRSSPSPRRRVSRLFARAQGQGPAGTLLFDDHQACEGFLRDERHHPVIKAAPMGGNCRCTASRPAKPA